MLAAAAVLGIEGGRRWSATVPPDPDLDLVVATWSAWPPAPLVLAVVDRRAGRLESALDLAVTLRDRDGAALVTGIFEARDSGLAVGAFPRPGAGWDGRSAWGRLEVACADGRSAIAHLPSIPVPTSAIEPSAVLEPAAASGNLRIRLAHESGVPVPGVGNRYEVTVEEASGGPVAAEVTIEGWGTAPVAQRTDRQGRAVFTWDPGEGRGYSRLGYAAGPRCRAAVRAGAGREAVLAFDPMRPGNASLPAWRPDPARDARGADGPARFLLRVQGEGPSAVPVVFAAEAGGAVAVFAIDADGRSVHGVRPVLAGSNVVDLPLGAAIAVRAVRITPDGSCAWDFRPVPPAPAAPSASGFFVVSSHAQARDRFEAGCGEAEEDWRRFVQSGFGAIACVGLIGMFAFLCLVPAALVGRVFGRGVGVGWGLAASLVVPLAAVAADQRWLSKSARFPALVAAAALVWAGAVAGYALYARRAGAKWAWFAAAAVAVAGAALFLP